jgi:hypothetical protein
MFDNNPTTNSTVTITDTLATYFIPMVAVIAALVLGAGLAASGMEHGLPPAILPAADAPQIEVTCEQGWYSSGHLVVSANEGSYAFSVYTHEGELMKNNAMPWQFSHDHDLWVKNCVQRIKAAAAQQ